MKLAGRKSALTPAPAPPPPLPPPDVFSTDRSKAVVSVLALDLVVLLLILRGDLFYVLPCYFVVVVFFFVCVFFSPFNIAITSLWEEGELVLVLFVRLFGLCLFCFVCFLFLLVSGKGCGL